MIIKTIVLENIFMTTKRRRFCIQTYLCANTLLKSCIAAQNISTIFLCQMLLKSCVIKKLNHLL